MRVRTITAMLVISAALFFITMPPAQSRLSLPTADSGDVAAMAAKALADSGDKEAIPVLRRMLNHPSIVVRYYAAYGLGKLGDKDSIQALKDSLWLPENDTPEDLLGSSPKDMWDGPRRLIYANGGYRQIACWALRQLGDTSVDKRFIEILFEDPSTAIPADLKKRIAELITQLGDSDWNKREEAQNALSEIGEAACMQLDEAKNSKDPEVVQRVSQLLEPLAHAYMRRRPEAYACLKTVASQELLKIRVENDTPFPYLEAHLSGCITHGYRRP